MIVKEAERQTRINWRPLLRTKITKILILRKLSGFIYCIWKKSKWKSKYHTAERMYIQEKLKQILQYCQVITSHEKIEVSTEFLSVFMFSQTILPNTGLGHLPPLSPASLYWSFCNYFFSLSVSAKAYYQVNGNFYTYF